MTRLWTLLPLLGIAGCAKKPAVKATPPPVTPAPKRTPIPPLTVATGAGSGDKRDPVKKVRLYTIKWQSAALTLAEGVGIQEGRMNAVTGTVYEGQKAKSTFAAETGYAKKATQTLFLKGKVEVRSPQHGAVLRAAKLEWLPNVQRYRATGSVTLSTPTGISGPMPELLATSDLRRFGTPDLFDQR